MPAISLLGVALVWVGGARADSVADSRGVFAEVTIVGLDDDQLTFRFQDGRSVSRSVLDVREIVLSTGADPAADEISRAEALRKNRQFDQAVALYERSRTAAERDWIRAYASLRMVDVYIELHQPEKAIDCYLTLPDKHPGLSVRAMPRRLPAADSPEGRKLLAHLDTRARSAPTEAMRSAIAKLRANIENADAPPATQAADDKAAAADKTARTKRLTAIARSSRPTADVYKHLSAGRRVEAWTAIEKGLREAGPSPAKCDVWWLAEAEYDLADGDATRAGLAAMKVIAYSPDSPYYAEALLLAGRAYEAIRPGKARSLYEECLKHSTADREIKDNAQARLAALAAAAATQRAVESPGK